MWTDFDHRLTAALGLFRFAGGGASVSRGGGKGEGARFVAWKETAMESVEGVKARERGNPKVGEASRRQKGRGFGGHAPLSSSRNRTEPGLIFPCRG